ncbi:lipopolysaccharide-binding protein-like [Xenia sp. Carnegie-2017]|uniref:lipopolysaccharide-binding protein-like n=1 Tax=Xenia sp. Carnegie-2017 TaxID=2897299 RepID=UPI001F03959A|nr:lipopolysaccharide-binding protein-like [Xenia sp. Carnegie-2017]
MQISNKLFSAIVNIQSHVNIMCFSPGSYQNKMATCISVLILYLCCTFISVDGTNPGIIIQVTNKGLAYVDKVATGVFIDKLKTTTVKDISGDTDTPLGHFDYDLSSIHCTAVSIATWSLRTVPGLGLSLSASGVSVSFNGHWHYRKKHWPDVSDSGNFDMSIDSVSFTLKVKIGVDKGKPTISTSSCTDNIGDVNVKFHGGASWLYNLFRHKIGDSIKSQLNPMLCEKASKAINEDAKSALATFPVRKQIDKYALIDYSLIQAPIFTESLVDISLKGEVMSASHPTESGLTPTEITTNQTCSKMICIYMTKYVANTAGQVYFQANFFKINVTPSEVPPLFKYQLNTDLFKLIGLSQVYDKYPDRPLYLHLYCTQPPRLAIKSTGLYVAISGNVEVLVLTKESNFVFLFTLATNITGNGVAQVNGTLLQGSVKNFDVKFAVFKSAVGDIKPQVGILNILLHLLAEKTIIKILNEKGAKGLPLPVVDKVALENPEIVLGENFISFDTDLKYKGSLKVPATFPIVA